MKKDPAKKTLLILGKPYVVEYVTEQHSCGNMGAANRCNQYIVVNVANAPAQQEETLLHEVIHVIDQELKLELTEETISRLAVGLYSAGYHLPKGLS